MIRPEHNKYTGGFDIELKWMNIAKHGSWVDHIQFFSILEDAVAEEAAELRLSQREEVELRR